MLDKNTLEKIKPGNTVRYTERWFDEVNEVSGKVIRVACRCGFTEDEHLVSDDDYIIVNNSGVIDEVNYKNIIDVDFNILMTSVF